MFCSQSFRLADSLFPRRWIGEAVCTMDLFRADLYTFQIVTNISFSYQHQNEIGRNACIPALIKTVVAIGDPLYYSCSTPADGEVVRVTDGRCDLRCRYHVNKDVTGQPHP